MLPDIPHLSDPTVSAEFIPPHNRAKSPLVDYARGGVALLDASKGLDVKDWRCEMQDGKVYITSTGAAPFLVETIQGVPTWISFAFDQNMHYNLAYTIDGSGSFLYWYDISRQSYVTDPLGDVKTPFLRMDDVSDVAFTESELVLSYIRESALCCRVQHDRFGVEYTLITEAGSSIYQCGMNKKRRFQWMCA